MSEESENQIVSNFVHDLLQQRGCIARDVPQKYVPKICIVLDVVKKNAISNGQANTVKKIQQILEDFDDASSKSTTKDDRKKKYIIKSTRKKKSNSRTTRPVQSSLSSQSSKSSLPQYSNEQLDSALEDLVNGNAFVPETEVLPDLIQYAKKKIDFLINDGELITAQKYEDINQQLMASKLGWNAIDSKSTKKNEIRGQLENTERNLQLAKEKMVNDLDDYNSRMNKMKEAQEEDFVKQMEEFDKITNGELPSHYRKFSQNLLNMREKERFLLRIRHFEDAGYVRMDADDIEQYELEQCRQKYLKAREVQKANLEEAHRQKMTCFDGNSERIRIRIQKENENRIYCLERAKANFQKRIETLDGEIKGTMSVTPAPSPLPSRPLSPHSRMGKNSTFMTQQQQQQQKQKQTSATPQKKKSTARTPFASPQMVYRPIPSKWRLQTPQATKVFR